MHGNSLRYRKVITNCAVNMWIEFVSMVMYHSSYKGKIIICTEL